jgi:hypothetical protein
MDVIRTSTVVLFSAATLGLAYALFQQTVLRFKGRRLSKSFATASPQYFKRYRATP